MSRSRKVGAFWLPRREGSKAKLSGEIEVNGVKVKCSMFDNQDYVQGGKKPKYVLLAFEDDEQKPGAPKESPSTRRTAPPRTQTPPARRDDPEVV
jgi:hypothetical protein